MSGTALHTICDVAAWLGAGLAIVWLSRRSQLRFPKQSFELPYLAALLFGAGLGAFLFGSLNLWLSGMPGLARSVEGALAGGIVAVELYKWLAGISVRTGGRFALPLAVGVAIGRIGCYLAGLDDFTYGTPTALPWGHDFGDGIARHPVQLYESAAMAVFSAFYVVAVLRQNSFVIANGFYLVLIYYGLQRFIWEFFKPYAALIGPLTLFHLLSLFILFYASVMLATALHARPHMNAPLRRSRPYIFWGQTQSLCETCLSLVPAKIQIIGNEVWYEKRCKQHGVQSTLVSTDAAYWKRCKEFIKPGDKPLAFQRHTEFGCPFDCGLCPDHEQHSCLALIEITEHCNLTCPVCFAESSPAQTAFTPLATVEKMLDALVASEGEPDLVQISGGEPTLHPDFFAILEAARARPIRHIMINTNGLRIAREPDFAARLAENKRGFEVYLQFDSLERDALINLRGADLRKIRQQALENLERHGISTTLVATIKRGVNDHEIGDIVRHALTWKCVRGVTLQPVQDAGRNENFNKDTDRIMLSEIRRRVVETGVFGDNDMIPLPCNPESISIGYGLRNGETVLPLTSLIPQEQLLAVMPNTISPEKYPALKEKFIDLFSLSSGPSNTSERVAELLCCLPAFQVPEGLTYENVFRVTIVQFLDRFNFCVGNVKRSCIHFVTANGEIIPFDTYNLFYRNGRIDGIRARLARQISAGRMLPAGQT